MLPSTPSTMWNSTVHFLSLLVSGATLCATSTTSVQLYAIVGNYVSLMCNYVQVLCPTISNLYVYVQLCVQLVQLVCNYMCSYVELWATSVQLCVTDVHCATMCK